MVYTTQYSVKRSSYNSQHFKGYDEPISLGPYEFTFVFLVIFVDGS